MKQLNNLNLKALESRMTKTSTTKEALSIVTPFSIKTSSKDAKIIVKNLFGGPYVVQR